VHTYTTYIEEMLVKHIQSARSTPLHVKFYWHERVFKKVHFEYIDKFHKDIFISKTEVSWWIPFNAGHRCTSRGSTVSKD